jgi:hypothetical protein
MEAPRTLSKAMIRQLLEALDIELARDDVHAEVFLVGGAVMCVALDARASTRDVDAVFKPAAAVRAAAARVAVSSGVEDTWLNDAVKGWMGTRGTFDRWFERPHLQVFIGQPEYILAMKCVAMRLGAEFHDLDDVRYLLRYLNITSTEQALAVVRRYFDDAQIPVKTAIALDELLGS